MGRRMSNEAIGVPHTWKGPKNQCHCWYVLHLSFFTFFSLHLTPIYFELISPTNSINCRRLDSATKAIPFSFLFFKQRSLLSNHTITEAQTPISSNFYQRWVDFGTSVQPPAIATVVFVILCLTPIFVVQQQQDPTTTGRSTQLYATGRSSIRRGLIQLLNSQGSITAAQFWYVLCHTITPLSNNPHPHPF